jgi:hypothetical protein
MLSRRVCLTTLTGLALFPIRLRAASKVIVYKDATCKCCDKWAEHLRKNNFDVQVKEVALSDLRDLKTRHGIPPNLQSCHTGIVDGYVIEGHVPAADVQRLLKERPKGIGLVVPGMPTGSPGMEGTPGDSYSVLLFDKTARTSVFRKYTAQ